MNRRRYQFSLRTLFVLFTAFCVWLGLHMHHVRQQQAAVEAIQGVEGSCSWENENATGIGAGLARWKSLCDLIGRDHFFDVTKVEVPQNSHVDAELMRRLAGLPELRVLRLSDTGVVDEDLAHLRGLSRLEELDLSNNPITDAAIAHLGKLTRLRRLSLAGARITDAGLAHLRNLRELESLALASPAITDAGLIHLQGLTRLEALTLTQTSVSGRGLAQLAGLKNLELLALDGTAIAGGDLGPIADFPKLTDLRVNNTGIADAGLARIGSMTQLRYLDLGDTAITEGGLAHLSQLRDLKALWLRDTAITDEGLGRLPVFRGLESLDLSGTRVTGHGLKRLKNHGVIGTVWLLNTKISNPPELPNTHFVFYVNFIGGVIPAPASFPCAGRRLVADAAPLSCEVFRQLAAKDTAPSTFARLLEPAAAKRVLRGANSEEVHEVAGTAFVRTPRGVGAVLLLAPAYAERYADTEIVPPGELKDTPQADRLIGLDGSGRPSWAAIRRSRWTAMAVMDADGDGWTEELVRWNTDFEKRNPSFLIVHDLARPGLPSMLAITLYDHKDPKRVRWSMPLGRQGYRDVVIEEKEGGKFRVRTVFHYRPESRSWDVDAATPQRCWKRLPDPRVEMDFEDLVHSPSPEP